MSLNVLYTAVATSNNGRDGRSVSNDGKIDLKLSKPKEMGGTGEGTNPEQLFAAGYSACFGGALGVVAGKAGVDVTDASVTAEVGIGQRSEGGFGLQVTLRVELPESISAEQGQELIEAAHQVCPYSNATRGNIEVTLVRE